MALSLQVFGQFGSGALYSICCIGFSTILESEKIVVFKVAYIWVQVKTPPSQNVPELVKTSPNMKKRLVKTSP